MTREQLDAAASPLPWLDTLQIYNQLFIAFEAACDAHDRMMITLRAECPRVPPAILQALDGNGVPGQEDYHSLDRDDLAQHLRATRPLSIELDWLLDEFDHWRARCETFRRTLSIDRIEAARHSLSVLLEEAYARVVACPAPDLAAVLAKVEIAADRLDAFPLPFIADDLRRLTSSRASKGALKEVESA